MNKKINLLWLVNDRYINNFITVYNECQRSDCFSIQVVATPHLHSWLPSNQDSSNDLLRFLRSKGIDSIDCYDESTKSYIDLSSLQPDYIFTTTQYDIYRPEEYNSERLAQLARLCNVEYGSIMIEYVGDYADLANNVFTTNASYIFQASPVSDKSPANYVGIGPLKLDDYLYYGRKVESPVWRQNAKFKVVWKPRWVIQPDASNLFGYSLPLYNMLRQTPEMDLVFLGHPLLQDSLKSTGQNKSFESIFKQFEQLPNFHVENSADFLDVVLSADAYIGDHSSTLIEFASTGKPFIYCETSAVLNHFGEAVVSNGYVAQNAEQAVALLKDLLNGKDPLKIKREKHKNTYFLTPPNHQSVAQNLLSFLKRDYEATLGLKVYYKEKVQSLGFEKRQLEHALEQSESELSLCKKDTVHAKEQLQALTNSTAWKMTKPFQWIVDKIKNLFSK